jgi:hypothetical protein
MLHPGLAEVYRGKVEKLTEALNKEELRAEAAEILRSTIQTIRLVPEDGQLAIELVGELAGILALSKEKSPRPFGPGARQITLVAGARSQCHYAHLSSYFVISSLTPATAQRLPRAVPQGQTVGPVLSSSSILSPRAAS